MQEYIVLNPDAHVEYYDGTEAADYAVLGIVEAESAGDAVTKAVEDISPMCADMAEDIEFRVAKVSERAFKHYEGDN